MTLFRQPIFSALALAALATIGSTAAASEYQLRVLAKGLTGVPVVPAVPAAPTPPVPPPAPQWTLDGAGTFALTTVGRESTPSAIQVKNTGTGSGVPLPTITGTNANDFYISSDGCTLPVAPSASCELGIRFVPAIAGPRTAVLTAGAATLAISGEGRAPDPADAKVVLLMSMDASPFTDARGHAISNRNVSGSATGKFGGSAYFAGTSSYFTSPNSADFGFGAQDFTMEAWVNTASGGNIISLRSDGSTVYYNNVMRIGAGHLQWSDGNAWRVGTLPVPANTWTHVAVARAGGKLRLFVNGVLDSEYSNTTNLGASRMAWIGMLEDGVIPFNGAIDELRVTKGIARYTGSFTPASAPASL